MPQTKEICLNLLGDFELLVDGDPVELPLRSQRLLAFVAVQTRTVARAFAAGSLWPDSTEKRAHGNLRSGLWQIQKTAGKIVKGRASLCIDPTVEVDLLEMQRCAARLTENGSVQTIRAATVFGRDLLPGWYDDWLLVEQERAKQVRLEALEQLSHQCRLRGECGRAAAIALEAVRGDPLRETARKALIAAHLSQCNLAKAVEAYRAFEHELSQEFGLKPSRDLRKYMARELRAAQLP